MARKTKNIKRSGLFFFWLPIGAVFAVLILFLSSRDFLRQRSCGCDLAETETTGDFDPAETRAFYDNWPVDYPLAQLESREPERASREEAILGVADDSRWIEVDLSDQKLYAHNGDKIDYEFLVSSGKPWTPTAKGDFRIWVKIRYAKMSGGSKENGSYYYLPNVPFIQYFYKDYGLHGAYWHNNFGNTMSHGCVNLSIPDAEKLFYWTNPILPSGKNMVRSSDDNPGTRVMVHE